MYTKKIVDGYFLKTVCYDKRLKYCPYGSAGVVNHDDGAISLYSYTTRVITIYPDNTVDCSDVYSRTTMRHISAFLREYLPQFNYYDMKELARRGGFYNVLTKEWKER